MSVQVVAAVVSSTQLRRQKVDNSWRCHKWGNPLRRCRLDGLLSTLNSRPNESFDDPPEIGLVSKGFQG